MSAPSKKRAVHENIADSGDTGEPIDISHENHEEDGSSSYSDEEMDGQEFIDQEVTVEFEARNLEDCDFHGIRKLLSQLFLKSNIDLTQLTETLISQNYIGSTIKQVEPDEEDSDDTEGDDDIGEVFGVISLLNLTERKNLSCIQQLKSTLLDRCSKCAQREKLAAFLNDSAQVGWILNERFINIPAKISLPSFDSLWREAERATKKNMKYSFSHYLMISKVCKLSAASSQGSVDVTTYINSEEELFAEVADVVCEYSVKEEHAIASQGQWDDDDDDMEPYRIVMVIPSSRIPDVMAKMKEAYG